MAYFTSNTYQMKREILTFLRKVSGKLPKPDRKFTADITLCMAFLAHLSMKPETNALKVSIIKTASPIKEKVHFCYYRLAKGVTGILSYAKEGVRLWFRTKRPTFRQLCLKLVV